MTPSARPPSVLMRWCRPRAGVALHRVHDVRGPPVLSLMVWLAAAAGVVTSATWAYHLASHAPAQSAHAWIPMPNTACSQSSGSVRINDYALAQQFDVPEAECRARCAARSGCQHFTYGKWLKGWQVVGWHGRHRCQLYSECVTAPQPQTTMFTLCSGHVAADVRCHAAQSWVVVTITGAVLLVIAHLLPLLSDTTQGLSIVCVLVGLCTALYPSSALGHDSTRHMELNPAINTGAWRVAVAGWSVLFAVMQAVMLWALHDAAEHVRDEERDKPERHKELEKECIRCVRSHSSRIEHMLALNSVMQVAAGVVLAVAVTALVMFARSVVDTDDWVSSLNVMSLLGQLLFGVSWRNMLKAGATIAAIVCCSGMVGTSLKLVGRGAHGLCGGSHHAATARSEARRLACEAYHTEERVLGLLQCHQEWFTSQGPQLALTDLRAHVAQWGLEQTEVDAVTVAAATFYQCGAGKSAVKQLQACVARRMRSVLHNKTMRAVSAVLVHDVASPTSLFAPASAWKEVDASLEKASSRVARGSTWCCRRLPMSGCMRCVLALLSVSSGVPPSQALNLLGGMSAILKRSPSHSR